LVYRLTSICRQTEYTNKLYRAIDPKLVFQNTGYNTRSDGFWVLEYRAPLEAYARAKSQEIDMKKWDLSVWQKEGEEWMVWEVWQIHLPGRSERRVNIFKVSKFHYPPIPRI
jgi:hypothetical protein